MTLPVTRVLERSHRVPLGSLLVAIAVTLPVSAQGNPESEVVNQGRLYAMWFYEDDFSQLWDRFLPEMKEALGSVESLDAVKDQVTADLGLEVELLKETMIDAQGYHVYLRFARFDGYEGRVLVQFALDDEGMIGGFYVRPAPGGE